VWLSDADAVQPSGAEAAAARAAAEGRAAAGGGPAGAAAVGWRVGIWWRDDQCFYYGRVDAHSADTGARGRAGGTGHALHAGAHVSWGSGACAR
jgi:hypothetical protein